MTTNTATAVATAADALVDATEATAKPAKKTKIALSLTVDQDEYLKSFSDLAAKIITSNKVIFENFQQFIADHYDHTSYVQHSRLYHLSDWEEVVDGEKVRKRHETLDVRCSSMLVSSNRRIYDITIYATISINEHQEFLFPLPMDLVRCGTPSQVKMLTDASVQLAETVSDDEAKEFAELNPAFDEYKGLTLDEDSNLTGLVLDFLYDTTDIADHVDE